MNQLPTPEKLFSSLKTSLTVPLGLGRGFTWRLMLEMCEGTGEVGEVRVASDWTKLPRTQSAVRFVVLRDNDVLVVRWATDEFLRKWGPDSKNPTHEGLIGYHDDLPQEARSGYVYILPDGSMDMR